MINTTKNDLDETIENLTAVLHSFQERRNNLDLELDLLIQERRNFIDDLSTKLLPSLSNDVYENLDEKVPSFIGIVEHDAFKANKRILGIFKPSTYNDTLYNLRMRLKAHLDQNQDTTFFNLSSLNLNVGKLKSDIAVVDRNMSELLGSISELQGSRKNKTSISPKGIKKLKDESTRYVKSLQVRSGRPLSQSTNADNDSDLLIYLATDIPTSLRTLMLDAWSPNEPAPVAREGSFSGAGASGSFDYNNSGSNKPDVTSDSDRSVSTYSVPDTDNYSSSSSSIDTSDRLGAFS